jgi:DNA-binding NarL/FixJ family response regulator
MDPTTILLIDDHQMIREGLKSILEGDNNYHVVGEAGNGEAGIRFLRKQNVDIVITDINMPVMDGVGFMSAVRKEFPGPDRYRINNDGRKPTYQTNAKGGSQWLSIKELRYK